MYDTVLGSLEGDEPLAAGSASTDSAAAPADLGRRGLAAEV